MAQEALYRQWREGCDDVRTTDSQANTIAFAELRKQQVRRAVPISRSPSASEGDSPPQLSHAHPPIPHHPIL